YTTLFRSTSDTTSVLSDTPSAFARVMSRAAKRRRDHVAEFPRHLQPRFQRVASVAQRLFGRRAIRGATGEIGKRDGVAAAILGGEGVDLEGVFDAVVFHPESPSSTGARGNLIIVLHVILFGKLLNVTTHITSV